MRLRRLLCLAAMAAAPPAVSAQSLVHRPPNLGGTWTPPAGVLQFNFMHRFYVAPSTGANKVTNFPTFTFALGLGGRLALGTHYGTNSFVVTTPYRPNEFELFARWRTGADEGADGVALSFTPAYNAAARSADGELGVDYSAGRVTLSGAVRGMAKPLGVSGDARIALAGGASLRLNDYIAVSGDVASVLGLDTTAAWSAGLSFVIPGSPHTFSLHASRAASNTIQGSSVGFSRTVYGFEFTIPIHFSRFAPWFSRAARARPVDVAITAGGFSRDTVTLRAGREVRWTNRDAVSHTLAFASAEPGGPATLAAHGAFTARFERRGTFAYRCATHPDMIGVVVVR
jgi:plastocyanin